MPCGVRSRPRIPRGSLGHSDTPTTNASGPGRSLLVTAKEVGWGDETAEDDNTNWLTENYNSWFEKIVYEKLRTTTVRWGMCIWMMGKVYVSTVVFCICFLFWWSNVVKVQGCWQLKLTIWLQFCWEFWSRYLNDCWPLSLLTGHHQPSIISDHKPSLPITNHHEPIHSLFLSVFIPYNQPSSTTIAGYYFLWLTIINHREPSVTILLSRGLPAGCAPPLRA